MGVTKITSVVEYIALPTSFLVYVAGVLILTYNGPPTTNENIQLRKSRSRAPPKFVALSACLVILLSHLADAVTLSWYGEPSSSTHNETVFSLFSILLWMTFFLLVWDLEPPEKWQPFLVSWIATFLFDCLLFGLFLSRPLELFTGTAEAFIVRAFRICILGGLCVYFCCLQCRSKRADTNDTDSEQSPLLANDRQKGSTSAEDYVSAYYDKANLTLEKGWWAYVKAFRVFVPHLWPKRSWALKSRVVGIGFTLLAGRAVNVLRPITQGMIIDRLAEDLAFPWLELLAYLVLRLLGSQAGLVWVGEWLRMPIDLDMTASLNSAIYEHIMKLSADFHDDRSAGFDQHMYRAHAVIGLTRTFSGSEITTMVDLIIAVGVLYWLFGAFMAFDVASVVVLFIWTNKKMLAAKMHLQRGWVKVHFARHDHQTETMSQWRTVTQFNRVDGETDKNKELNADEQVHHRRLSLTENTFLALNDVVLLAGLVPACILAIEQIRDGHRKIGDFVILLTYWAELSNLSSFSRTISNVIRNLVDAEKLLELMQQKPSVTNRRNATPLRLTKGEVTFDDVSFSYDGKRPILKNITITGHNSGQTIALVGETGSGKSTIINLLQRLYDLDPDRYPKSPHPVSGTIKIDDQDIRDVTLASLRAAIAVVPQDPMLFNSTIVDNLLYAAPDATRAECEAACKAAALHDQIATRFPNGYDTLVGARGVKLSGGELQRLAVARAMLKKDAKILLLDEATSAVDGETERRIQEGLRMCMRGRTTFVIAHRLSTIRRADRILVLRQGEIVQQGRHEELLADVGGVYERMWNGRPKVVESEFLDIAGEGSGSTGV